MAETRPLPIYPWPVPVETMELIKRAKAELDLPFLVIPSEAVPGSPGRILSFGTVAPFVCDCALVKDPTAYASVLGALSWVLTAAEGDKSGFMVEDYMSALLGATEITDTADLAAAGVVLWDR